MKGANTHAEMNKDTEGTTKGKEKICTTCNITLFQIAKHAATKHTAAILIKKK